MTVTYETAFRNAQATACKDSIENGAVGSGGYMCFETSADVILGSIQFDDPCGSVATGALTFSGWTDELDAPATGTIEHASVYDNSGAFESQTGKQFEVTCQTGAGSNVCVVSSLSIDAGDTITLNSASWTFPSSI